MDEENLNIDNYVLTTMDADTRWHEKHFAALTYHFAINPKTAIEPSGRRRFAITAISGKSIR